MIKLFRFVCGLFLSAQFIRFGVVGTGGYLVNVFILKALKFSGMGPYSAEAVAFFFPPPLPGWRTGHGPSGMDTRPTPWPNR